MPILYILSGAPGSGKSTWASKRGGKCGVIISRDKIRFALVRPDEPYFQREKIVQQKYKDCIKYYLSLGYDVVADATCVSNKARRRFIESLELQDDVQIIPVYFDVRESICIKRNRLREGRAKVPTKVVRQMSDRKQMPHFEDCDKYIEIWRITSRGGLVKTKREVVE